MSIGRTSDCLAQDLKRKISAALTEFEIEPLCLGKKVIAMKAVNLSTIPFCTDFLCEFNRGDSIYNSSPSYNFGKQGILTSRT